MAHFNLICTYISSYKRMHKVTQVFNQFSMGLRILQLGGIDITFSM